MSHWQKIREVANVLRNEINAAFDLEKNELETAQKFLERAAEYLELELVPEHPDSGNLSRALAVLEDDCVYYDNHLKKWYRAFCIAHEIGHYRLHRASIHCSHEEIQDFDGENDSATEKIVGYGAGERREREANLFALELLLPCRILGELYLEQNYNARKIAEIVEMPAEVVSRQLARALLVPISLNETNDNVYEKTELNESQRRAAETKKCPTLVYAGPGTGKTQTLTHRIAHLIERGIEPKRILALTFSNKAAEEMRERIGKINETIAGQIQVLTFHAYGLDILRSFWVEAKLEPRSKLLDKIDALLHLEKSLNLLELEHYQSLHEPTTNLAAILSAISRAKDELCSPEKYRELGEKMHISAAAAGDEELQLKAGKVLETARVYEFYQKHLEREKMLDFGDLVYRAVVLLQENEAVRCEVRGRYDAILVDEFQDVNRACGMLLKEIAGAGEKLWTVGDLRQSIYRWRGASPANIELFSVDFPDAETISLEMNYRSKTEIVELFANFAGVMKTAGDEVFNRWQAVRGDGKTANFAPVKLEIADSLESEAANIAAQIENYHAQGVNFKDCAVICRTHRQLHKFAEILSAKGVPIFYLGEIFEREEVRDLLALLDLKVTTATHSLVRVSDFPEYKIPLADVRKIIQMQKENKLIFAAVVKLPELLEELSEQGKIGALKLAAHLSRTAHDASAWSFLSSYLFAESDYLKPLLDAENVDNQSQKLAIYQFVRFAQNLENRFAENAGSPIGEMLAYVKKLAHFNEDKNYANLPAESENLDAVRLLTVHSAKGLEFPVVFLPALGAGKIPAKAQIRICPNPDEMIDGETDFHEAEEECLFFVAMSRARDSLHLSRATKYGKTNSNESKFLTNLAEFLPVFRQVDAVENAYLPVEMPEIVDSRTFYAAELDKFLRCGRDYYYSNVLGLKSSGEQSIYLKFHSCVYDTLRSMQSIRQLENIELTEETAFARLDEFWMAAEIDAHPYAPIYKTRAAEIVRRLCGKMTNGVSANEISRPTYEIKLAGGTVRVQPDAIEIIEKKAEKTAVIRKYKTGKSPKTPAADNIDVLITAAVGCNFPDAKTLLQKTYLSDDAVLDVPISPKVIENRLKIYEEAIEKISRKVYDPSPSDDNCPFCPHFFICPSGGLKS